MDRAWKCAFRLVFARPETIGISKNAILLRRFPLEFHINSATKTNAVCETAIPRPDMLWNEAEVESQIEFRTRRAAAPTDALVRAMKGET